MNKREYNGWYNYETWNFALWFNPDDFQDDMESISEDYDRKPGPRSFSCLTDEDQKINRFSDFLKDWFEDYLQETLVPFPWSGIAGDLLNSAVSEINFDDISKNWMGTYLETLAKEA